MKRIIYSIYIDIPSDELDYQPPYHGETEDKNQKAKRVFRENYEWLTHMQKSWSNSIGIEYRQYTRDDKYLEFESFYKEKYPFITTWNIVNFYKLHLMYELSKEGFDEILYLDIDVVPVSKLNFFEEWNLDRGIAILTNDPKIDRSLKTIADNEWIDNGVHLIVDILSQTTTTTLTFYSSKSFFVKGDNIEYLKRLTPMPHNGYRPISNRLVKSLYNIKFNSVSKMVPLIYKKY